MNSNRLEDILNQDLDSRLALRDSQNHAILSFIERYVPNDVILTYKGKSSIDDIIIYPPREHLQPSPIVSNLNRVDILCRNGCVRFFGFVNASFVIDKYGKKRCKVSGYNEKFEEIKSWELAK